MTLLALEQVSFSYWRGRKEVRALSNVSLEVPPGELVVVYGKAAAGKSTLLKVAAGLTAPDEGRVLFDGHDLSECTRGHIARLHRKEIGWAERSGPKSDGLSVVVYVALKLYREHGARHAQRMAIAALDKVGAARCASERWTDLPDTDRVLVAIAQACVHKPRLLVVDDPTYGFPAADRERIVALLKATAEDDAVGVLMAVPDMPALLSAHKLRLLHHGRLVAPADLASSYATNVVRFPHDRRGG